MDVCPRCTKPILPTAVVCPHCGANTGTFGGPAEGPSAARPPRVRRSFGEDGPTFPVVKLALVLFAAGLLVWWLLPVKFPDITLSPAGSNPGGYDQCEGKERCIMVFVAPWCPACKQSIGTIKGMLARCAGSSEVGVKAIIGSGRSPQSMEDMAAQIGRGVFLDPGGQVMAAAGERSVPHWIVLDQDGMLIKKQAGVIPNVEVMFKELDLPNCSLGG